MNVERFFSRYVEHLKSHETTIRSFIVTTAAEAWFSMEAAALADKCRDEFDIAGQLEPEANGSVPRWLIAAERGKVDLWIEDQSEQKPWRATAVEFKLVHNNKNFEAKLAEVQHDLAHRKFPEGTTDDTDITQFAIVIAIYLRFLPGQEGNYKLLGGFGAPVTEEEFLHNLSERLGSTGLEVTCHSSTLAPLFGLDEAHYIDKGQGAGMWVYLVRPKSANQPR